MRRVRFLVVALLAAGAPIAAADWPQFLGPDRNGVYTGPPLATSWPAAGPRVVWRKQVGAGFAGPVVAGSRLILFHRVAREEIVESLDARTGTPQWRFAYPTTYRDDFGFDEGPRAVPIVMNGRVYTFGAEGQLHAIDLLTGRSLWNVDTARPLRTPNRVQGSQVTELWSGDEMLSNHYATAVHHNGVLYGFHGRQEYNPSFRAVDLKTGAVKWSTDQFKAGSVTLVGNELLIVRETGELVLAAAMPQAFRPIARAQILPATVRSFPALSDGFLYVRNNDTRSDTLLCLDLRKTGTP